MNFKLTNRLEKIASMVKKGCRIADIGTDHGYIPVYLLKKGTVTFAILADINKGPLENGKKLVRNNNLLDRTEFRLGSGIEVLKPGEVDEAIIAGMGGILISEILDKKPDVAHVLHKIILQPMQAPEKLRDYLFKNGYEIIKEVLVKEDFRIYEILEVKYTGKEYREVESIYLEVGEKLILNKDPLLKEFIEKKINSYIEVLNRLKDLDGEAIDIKKCETRSKIEKLEDIIKSIEE